MTHNSIVLKPWLYINNCMFIVRDKIEESEKPTQATLVLATASSFWVEFASYNFLVTHDPIV